MKPSAFSSLARPNGCVVRPYVMLVLMWAGSVVARLRGPSVTAFADRGVALFEGRRSVDECDEVAVWMLKSVQACWHGG